MSSKTIIVYLTGRPGMGKYTIAKALAHRNGYIICDNQLINNPIFELLQYDGYAKIPPIAWTAIGRMRAHIFDFLGQITENSYVLTNNLSDDAGDRELYEAVKTMAEQRGSLFVPVRLSIDREEHVKRIVRPDRRARWKSIDPNEVDNKTPLLPISHSNLFNLEVTQLTPEQAAEAIEHHIERLL